MLDSESRNFDANGDPAPSFATEAEIEMAERLRHQIEERYLDRSTTSAPGRIRPAESRRR